MANVSFNPSLMTAPQNSFLVETQGWTQGLTQDDYISRGHLKSGVVAAAVTQPIWGGLGITVKTANVGGGNGYQPIVGLAATTEIDGFTVFDQAINMIQVPGNSVATASAGNSVAFYEFGSKATIPLPIAAGTLANFENVSVGVTLYWDTVIFVVTTVSGANTVALPATCKLLAANANSKTVNYNSGTGAVTWLDGQNAVLVTL